MEEKKLTLTEDRKRFWRRQLLDNNSVIILMLLLIVCFTVVDGFSRGFYNVLVDTSLYGMVAVGLSFVLITGNIDLSIGFQMGVAAVVSVVSFSGVLDATGSAALALIVSIIASMACGAVTGAINGVIITRIGISPLIATIATNYIYKGVVFYTTNASTLTPTAADTGKVFKYLGTEKLFGLKWLVPALVAFILILLIVAFLMRKTRFGNSVYVAGDNPEAGEYAGINIRRTTLLAYIICGVCCAVAGVFMASKNGGAFYALGDGREVFAISACVIGGVKMVGGKGTMFNVVLGILIMRIISTMMNVLILPTAWVNFISGALLIVVLLIDRVTTIKKTND